MFPLHALQIIDKFEVRKGVKLTKMCHLFSFETSFFEILSNIDVISRGEGVEIAKIGEEKGKRGFQELFKSQIGLYVTLLVAQISGVKGTPLFSDF